MDRKQSSIKNMEKKELYLLFKNKLEFFGTKFSTPGIENEDSMDCLVKQMVDSYRRIEYPRVLLTKKWSYSCADATSIAFDPLKAAVFHMNNNNLEEAFWLVFLFVHFGKNTKTGWNLLSCVYSGLGKGSAVWDWNNIVSKFDEFRYWLDKNKEILKNHGKFGNHRKYESLDAYTLSGTGSVIGSYIDFILKYESHVGFIEHVKNSTDMTPRGMFDYMYKALSEVVRFGRIAKFDYLSMIGKLKLSLIEPGSAYINEATGPKRGAILLFGADTQNLEFLIGKLDEELSIPFGMQLIEDSICNWQKKPFSYKRFIG